MEESLMNSGGDITEKQCWERCQLMLLLVLGETLSRPFNLTALSDIIETWWEGEVNLTWSIVTVKEGLVVLQERGQICRRVLRGQDPRFRSIPFCQWPLLRGVVARGLQARIWNVYFQKWRHEVRGMELGNSQKLFAPIDGFRPQCCSGNCFLPWYRDIPALSLAYICLQATAIRLQCHCRTLEFLWMQDSLPCCYLSSFRVVFFGVLTRLTTVKTLQHYSRLALTELSFIRFYPFWGSSIPLLSLLFTLFNISCLGGSRRLLGRQPRTQSTCLVWTSRWIGLLKLRTGLPQPLGWLLWRLSRTKWKANSATWMFEGDNFKSSALTVNFWEGLTHWSPDPTRRVENRGGKANPRFQGVLFSSHACSFIDHTTCNLYITRHVCQWITWRFLEEFLLFFSLKSGVCLLPLQQEVKWWFLHLLWAGLNQKGSIILSPPPFCDNRRYHHHGFDSNLSLRALWRNFFFKKEIL